MSTAGARHGHHHRRYHHHWFGLGFLVQGRVAAPAIVIDRTELNQQAMIATDDFPRIYWGKSRSHRVVGVPEPALLATRSGHSKWGRGFRRCDNMLHAASECKGKKA